MSQETEQIAKDIDALAKRLEEGQQLLKNSQLKVEDLQSAIDATLKLKTKLTSAQPPSRS